MAKKKFFFDFKISKSISGGDGYILEIKNINNKND